MTDSLFAELTRDFQDRYGVRAETASHMVDIFIAVAVSHGKEQAEAEFGQTVLAALVKGEAWARDYVDSYIRTQYAQAPAIHAEAKKAGTDPAAALQAVYGMQPQAAAELAAMLDAPQN